MTCVVCSLKNDGETGFLVIGLWILGNCEHYYRKSRVTVYFSTRNDFCMLTFVPSGDYLVLL